MNGTIRRILKYGDPTTKLAGPREIATSFAEIVSYFIGRGVLGGVNLRIEPDHRPSRASALTVLSLLILVALMAPGELKLGLALILLPLALYALPKGMNDRIMENRAYFATLGVGVVGAWCAERSPYAVALLGILWVVATVRRNRAWRNKSAYRTTAYVESPESVRARINYAIQLSQEGKSDDAIAMYEDLWAYGEGGYRERGIIAGNLAYKYIDRFEETQEKQWVEKAAALLDRATEDLGEHSLVRFARGHMFMGFGLFNEAAVELTAALKTAPGSTIALRHRAVCWGKLGRAELAKADLALAELQDGMPGRLVFKDAAGPIMQPA